VSDRALKPARDLVNWFSDTFNARGENKDLKKQLADVREQPRGGPDPGAAGEGDQEAGSALLVGADPGGPDAGDRAGDRPLADRLVLDGVDRRGIERGHPHRRPVVTGDGLVGRISTLTPNTAQVTLITDHTSSVAARVEPVGATGVVEPEVGDPRDLVLDFVEHGKDINETEPVVTAGFSSGGLSSLYPPGIPIGQVSQSSVAEQDAYQRVHIQPYADLRDMEFVQVLVEQGGK